VIALGPPYMKPSSSAKVAKSINKFELETDEADILYIIRQYLFFLPD